MFETWDYAVAVRNSSARPVTFISNTPTSLIRTGPDLRMCRTGDTASLLLLRSPRFATHFVRRQLNYSAVQSEASVFVNRFRYGYFESNFRPFLKRQP